MIVGAMTMPPHFKYARVYQKGRPQHRKFDDFWRRHIPMDPGHRAKIFAPFDALRGFDEAIASKEVLYESRRNIDRNALDRKLSCLSELSDHRPPVTITWFVPCSDVNNDACEQGLGSYKTLTGTIDNVDTTAETISIAGRKISFEDIMDIDFAAADQYPLPDCRDQTTVNTIQNV